MFLCSDLLVSATGGFPLLLDVPAAFALLVFCLLYTPCVAAVASINRELGAKWAVSVVILQCAVAWLCALLAHSVLLLF